MKVITTGKTKKSPSRKQKRSPQNFKYNEYLEGQRLEVPTTTPRGDNKIARLQRQTKSPNRQNKSKDIRDINDISMKMIQMKKDKIQVRTQNKAEDVTPEKVVKTPEKVVKTPDKVVKTPEKVVKTPDKVVKTPEKVVKTPEKKFNGQRGKNTRSNTRSNKRSHKRKSNGKTRNKNRNISVKTRVFNEYDVKIVESKIKEIRSRNPSEIKAELENQGVKVSGKSNRLLKDIYLYSKLCNINIKHEK